MRRYPLDMIDDAASVILNAEGSFLEYTPSMNQLEVVLRSRGLRLTGLEKVIVNKSRPGEWNVLYPTYYPDKFSSFFNSQYWLELIGNDRLECFMIKGTPTRRSFTPLGRYSVMIRADEMADAWIQLEFKSAVDETGLSYDRVILREEEYIHEYSIGERWAGSVAGHRANLVALQERRLAVMMSLHPRLGEGSILCQLGDEREFLRGICDGDV